MQIQAACLGYKINTVTWIQPLCLPAWVTSTVIVLQSATCRLHDRIFNRQSGGYPLFINNNNNIQGNNYLQAMCRYKLPVWVTKLIQSHGYSHSDCLHGLQVQLQFYSIATCTCRLHDRIFNRQSSGYLLLFTGYLLWN